MSDIDHPYDEDHIRPVPLEGIPRHTWVVTVEGQNPRGITTHMALRPTEDFPGWRFVDFVDNDEGVRLEHNIELIDAEKVTSVVLVRPDGSRKEMVGGD
jgi:hypothetical protein